MSDTPLRWRDYIDLDKNSFEDAKQSGFVKDVIKHLNLLESTKTGQKLLHNLATTIRAQQEIHDAFTDLADYATFTDKPTPLTLFSSSNQPPSPEKLRIEYTEDHNHALTHAFSVHLNPDQLTEYASIVRPHDNPETLKAVPFFIGQVICHEIAHQCGDPATFHRHIAERFLVETLDWLDLRNTTAIRVWQSYSIILAALQKTH